MISWTRKNRLEFTIILLILALAAFLRLYRIDEYMTFLGDEGRDAIVIKNILVNKDIPFIGPPTSIGNMYLGPLYYYMMVLPMFLFWLNPVAAAVQVGIIGVLTVGLIYYLCRQWFGKWAALISALLYAISPVTIIYSRSSWNPNPAPFFALLAILGLFKAHRSGNFLWFILTGVSLAFVVQMHYLALILLPVIGILWVYELALHISGKLKREHLVKGTIGAVIAFLLLMSPLVFFDLKHNFMNYRAVMEFFSNRETTVNINPINSLGRAIPIYSNNLVGRYVAAQDITLGWVVSILILIPIITAFVLKLKSQRLKWQYLMLAVWLGISILGLTLYKQNIYDHYLGFINPAPFILLGAVVVTITLLKNKLIKNTLYTGFAVLVLILVYLNIETSPIKNSPNRQLQRTQAIAKYVIEQSENKPFNFALLAKSNYDSAYQYYLDLYGHKPLQVPFDITQQLFVVCEDEDCQPINNPKYEIVAFGWGKIESEEEIFGVKVIKIVHNPTGASQ